MRTPKQSLSLVTVLLVALALGSLYCDGAKTISTSMDAVAEFNTWIVEIGGRMPKTVVKDTKNGNGNGIIATKAIKERDIVISIPQDYVMYRDTIQKDCPALSDVSAEDDMLAIFILREKNKGKKSKWYPFMKVLPDEVPLPTNFNSEELDMIQDTTFADSIVSNKADLENRYYQVKHTIANMLKKDKVKMKGAGDLPEGFKLKDWLWANSLISSRAWSMMGKKVLVPAADMFNYGPLQDDRVGNAGEFFLRYHKHENDRWNVYSDRACPKGEELLEDYGDNPNKIYFEYHGFVPDDNPFDCTNIMLYANQDGSSISEHEPKGRVLKERRMYWKQNFCVGLKMGDYTVRRFLEFIKIRNMSDTSAEACGNNVSTCLRNVMSEISVLAEAKAILGKTLEGYPTNVEEDENILEEELSLGRRTNHKKVLAVKYRMQQKRSLMAAQEMFEDMSRSVKGEPKPKKEPKKEPKNVHNSAPAPSSGNDDDDDDDDEDFGAGDSQENMDTVGSGNSGSTYGGFAGSPRNNDVDTAVFGSVSDLVSQMDVDEFNEWIESEFNEAGATLKLEAVLTEHTRVGARAREDLDKEELYLAVPKKVLFMEEHAMNSKMGPVMEELNQKFSHDNYHIMLFYLVHEINNPRSFWKPYFKLLPKSLDMPLYWSDEDLEHLKGTSVYKATVDRNAEMRRIFSKIKENVFDQYPETFPSRHFNWENYKWAGSILDSRSIWMNGNRHLIPMLDFINCREGPTGKERVHSTQMEGSTANTYAPWAFKKGEEVYENYGQPNPTYMQYHGFMLDRNSNDCAYVSLRTNVGNMGKDVCLSVSKPSTIMDAIKFIEREDPHQDAWKSLLRAIKAAKKKFPTSLKDDKAFMKSSEYNSLSQRARLSVKYRVSQKKILKKVQKYVKARMARDVVREAKDEL